jgi:RNA polymerase sigma factor (sigma-70 family)
MEPFINRLCQWRLLTDKLGQDEVRSMAALATVEFLMTYNGPLEGRKIPVVLRWFVRCELLDTLRGQNSRRKYELPEIHCVSDGPEEDSALTRMEDSNPDVDPEYILLREDLRHEVHDAIRNLNPNEQAVIHSFHFKGERIGDISRQLHCSPQYARRLHRAAIRRLREQLEKRLV